MAAQDPVTAWARRVVAGKVPAGPGVRGACTRHLHDLETQAEEGLSWQPRHARWAITFFANLMHTRGEWAGQPFVLAPWQAFIVGSLFGWRDASGLRRFREAYIEIPRKNGKSTLAAGLALLLAFFDDEAGARVYCAATKRDQARIVWEQAKEIVLRTPALRRRLTVAAKSIGSEAMAQKLEPLGADTDVLDGLDVHAAIVDEIHAHRTAAMVNVLKTATVARRQPLMFYITTAAKDRKTICGEQHDYSLKVLEGGTAAPDWFAFIASADAEDDWRELSTWKKANPNYGISVRAKILAQQAKRAEAMPAYQTEFRRLHLNEWMQPDNRALTIDVWNQGARDLHLDDLRGRVAVAGLDLSAKIDVTALVLVFPDPDGGATVLPYFFIPEDTIPARVQRDRGAPFDLWVRNGLVEATSGNLIDQKAIIRKLVELSAIVRINEVAMDPWNASALGTDLRAEGFDVIEVPQRLRYLAEPTKQFLALVETGKLRHPAHPCLDWMAANVALLTDAQGNQMPDKGRSTGRIDGISASVTALARAMLPDADRGSAYADHGLVVV
jgi:phage terminase large subunit-like protein